MNRRSAIAILVGTAFVMPASAWAQGNGNGNGNGGGNGNNGNGNANGHDDSNAGGNGNANGHEKGNDEGVGNSGNGNGKANGQGQGDTAAPGNPATADDNAELTESEVLAAVQTGSAVSLDTLLPDVRTRTGGEIINAKLQEARGFLLYAVTVLTPAGKVMTEYYYARSGIHVGN
jgi:hypothetical protein